jgi:hypothetical protein
MNLLRRPLVAAYAVIELSSCAFSRQTKLPAPIPAYVSAARFQSLRWLEGRWRGTTETGTPFYEDYRLVDDSTIRSLSLADSAGGEAKDSNLVRLSSRAIFFTGGTSQWVATVVTDTRLHFEPIKGAANSFTWVSESPDAWTATLMPRAGQPAQPATVYHMQRIGH